MLFGRKRSKVEKGDTGRWRSVRPGKKLKILNLARNGKMPKWDKLKPVIF